MAGTRVAVYGLSTEGYSAACRMAVGGADVSIIDELTPSAISLKAEVAKTYPDVSSLKEDEPLLSMEPIDVAISKARYLLFAPRIRKTGPDTKTEIHSKFKDATSPLKKNSSVVYCLPTGFGGNSENITLLEHVTGLEVGRTASYYYYPLGRAGGPPRIGSLTGKGDERLSGLLAGEEGAGGFVLLQSAEQYHAIETLSRFTSMCGVLEVCRQAQGEQARRDMSSEEIDGMFLSDMAGGMYDLRSLGSSFEGATTLMYLVNGSIKGMDGYIKRLIDAIRSTLKRNDLKASKTKIALSWTLDQHEMRGDRMEMLHTLTSRLRDYIGDVETYGDPGSELFHTDKTTIAVACSRADYEAIARNKERNMILIKANPLCEVIQ